jgi:hypothetical protein
MGTASTLDPSFFTSFVKESEDCAYQRFPNFILLIMHEIHDALFAAHPGFTTA